MMKIMRSRNVTEVRKGVIKEAAEKQTKSTKCLEESFKKDLERH